MGNMLMNKELHLLFDRVFVISTALHQKIHQMMMEHFAGIDERIRSVVPELRYRRNFDEIVFPG